MWVLIDVLNYMSKDRPPSSGSAVEQDRGFPGKSGGWAVTMYCVDLCLTWWGGIAVHVTSSSVLFLFYSSSSNIEEDVALTTNKQIYSQLLRATANRNTALWERVDVLIRLLDELAPGRGSTVP